MTLQTCKIEDGLFINPCELLSKAAEAGNPQKNKRGIFHAVYFNITTGQKKRSFFLVKGGDFLAQGIALNFCPFCGNAISEPFAHNNT